MKVIQFPTCVLTPFALEGVVLPRFLLAEGGALSTHRRPSSTLSQQTCSPAIDGVLWLVLADFSRLLDP